MKKLVLLSVLCFLSCSAFTQTIHVDTIVFDQSTVQALYTDPQLYLGSSVSGEGVFFTRSIIMKVYNDGSPFVFQSGATLDVTNDANVLNIIQQFSDPCVTDGGMTTGQSVYSYEVVRNGQVINGVTSYGMIRFSSSAPITGGGPNSHIDLICTYQYLSY